MEMISSYTRHNKVKLIRGGAAYFTLLEEMIDSSRYTIHLHTYIYESDETGSKIAEALIRAVNRNVCVYMLLDGYASGGLPGGFIKKLRSAGINLSFFEPFFRSTHFYIGRRLHYKVVVVDSYRSLVGGINIGNRYNDTNAGKAWLDWAIYTEGEVSMQLTNYCTKMWNGSFRRKKIAGPYLLIPKVIDTCIIKVRRNDWVNRYTEVYQSYMELFRIAKEKITLMSSYFFPGRRLLNEMTRASQNGVQVQLILAGRSDVSLAKYAERYIYRKLLNAGIEIYEYQDNILHGKIAVGDRKQVIAGSYNVNNISAYASIELDLDIKNVPFAQTVDLTLQDIINTGCIKITKDSFANNYNAIQRFFHQVSFDIIHVLFFLFTFYFKQSDPKN